MARSRRKRGGGNSGVKLRDKEGNVVKDGLGRAMYATGGKTPPSNLQRTLLKHRARELYADALIKEKKDKKIIDRMSMLVGR